MRKIEQQMCDAVQSNKNWQSANTSVHFDPETGVSIVRLHGNKIAEVSDTDMTIFDGGWQTNTTKSRLNALCEYFCVDGEGVFQKDFAWYVRKFVGAINGQSKFVTETFQSGYVFAWDDYTERLTLSPYSLPFILYTLIMKTHSASNSYKVDFDSFEYVLLLDMLSDVISNKGKLDHDLMDYFDTDSDDNVFISLYDKISEATLSRS